MFKKIILIIKATILISIIEDESARNKLLSSITDDDRIKFNAILNEVNYDFVF